MRKKGEDWQLISSPASNHTRYDSIAGGLEMAFHRLVGGAARVLAGGQPLFISVHVLAASIFRTIDLGCSAGFGMLVTWMISHRYLGWYLNC